MKKMGEMSINWLFYYSKMGIRSVNVSGSEAIMRPVSEVLLASLQQPHGADAWQS